MRAVRVFLTFLVAYVLSQFYRSFLAVIAPELATELSLDPQALGNLQAFWIAGFVLTQFPVGWALDTIGPRRTVSAQMLAAVAGAALFAMAQSAFQLNLAMVLIGVGCGSIYMGAIYMFGRIAAPQRFALLCSWLLGIGTAGNLLAASPLAWAAQSIGWRGAMAAWRWQRQFRRRPCCC
jgi:MFS family permease